MIVHNHAPGSHVDGCPGCRQKLERSGESRRARVKKSDIPDESFDVLKQAAGYCAIRLQQGEDPIEVTVELAVAAWLRGKKDERAISARALAILAALVDPKLTNAQEAATLMEEARDLLDE